MSQTVLLDQIRDVQTPLQTRWQRHGFTVTREPETATALKLRCVCASQHPGVQLNRLLAAF